MKNAMDDSAGIKDHYPKSMSVTSDNVISLGTTHQTVLIPMEVLSGNPFDRKLIKAPTLPS